MKSSRLVCLFVCLFEEEEIANSGSILQDFTFMFHRIFVKHGSEPDVLTLFKYHKFGIISNTTTKIVH